MLKRQIVPLFMLVYISVVPTIEAIIWTAGWYDVFWMGLLLFVGFGMMVGGLRAISSPFWIPTYWAAVSLSVVIGIVGVLRFNLSWPWTIPTFVGIVTIGLILYLSINREAD